MPIRFLLAVLAGALLLTGCASTQDAPEVTAEPTQHTELSVYATTGYLADAVTNIAPDAEVITMVGPGGDPHTHQPSTQDIEAMQQADLVLWNGLQLEAHLTDRLESMGDRQLAVGERLPTEMLVTWPDEEGEGPIVFDPHVWNSPDAWSLVVDEIAVKLGEIDPDRAEEYAANAAGYREEIASVAAETEALLADIPPESRVLITGHDAFNYFGDTYDFEVHATDFLSTDAVLSPQELSDLAQLIVDRKVPVIFHDNQANPQAITSLREAVEQHGWEIEIADSELYADSLGSEPGVTTYLGVFAHNAQAVADALGGQQQ